MNDSTPTPPPPPANAPNVSVSAIEALKSPTNAGQDNALASPKVKGKGKSVAVAGINNNFTEVADTAKQISNTMTNNSQPRAVNDLIEVLADEISLPDLSESRRAQLLVKLSDAKRRQNT